MKMKHAVYILIIGSIFLSACAAASYVHAEPILEEGRLSPAETVESFYQWYIDYSGTAESSSFRSPLSDKAYRESEYLSTAFIQSIDTFMTLPPEQANHDPILCAQNVPGKVFVEAVYQSNEKTRVLVGDDFAGYHRFTVDLVDQESQWLIDSVVCAISPAGAAEAFYTWYLGSIGAPGSEDFHNLLADGTYRESGLLSDGYISKVDELLASFEHGGYDPFLMAQDLPREFSVESGTDEMSALVHLYFGTETVHDLIVNFTQEKGWLQINSIQEANPPEDIDPTATNTEPIQVSGWLGYVVSLPDGSQYEDKLVLMPEGTGELGISGATPEIEAEIIALRDKVEPGKYAHFWGRLTCSVPDVNGCQFLVERLRYGASATEPEPIEDWEGTLKTSTFNGGESKVFVLDSPFAMQYSIDSNDPEMKTQLESLATNEAQVKVWGDLITGVPDVNGSRIQINKVEVLGEVVVSKPVTKNNVLDLKAGWQTYSNPMFGYQIQHPETARLEELPISGFPQDELPDGMSEADYMKQLEVTYGNSLCVQIEYALGYITISAPPNKGNKYVTCGRTGAGAGEMEGVSETITINGLEMNAKGFQIKGENETLDQSGETLWVELDDGIVIEYGSLPERSATLTDYQMKGAKMVREMVERFNSTK